MYLCGSVCMWSLLRWNLIWIIWMNRTTTTKVGKKKTNTYICTHAYAHMYQNTHKTYYIAIGSGSHRYIVCVLLQLIKFHRRKDDRSKICVDIFSVPLLANSVRSVLHETQALCSDTTARRRRQRPTYNDNDDSSRGDLTFLFGLFLFFV